MREVKVDADSRTTAQRLRDALATMVRTPSTGVAVQPLTATTLCQIAGISRNALYRYHPEVLAALHEAQRSARGPSGAPHVRRSCCARRTASCASSWASWPRSSITTSRLGRTLTSCSNGESENWPSCAAPPARRWFRCAAEPRAKS